MNDIVIRMAGGARSGPFALAKVGGTRVSAAVAFGSLILLAVGVVGRIASASAVSAFGLFLYALIGFGSAPLLALGYRGRNLLALSAPLGLGFLLVAGAVLSTTGIWAIGPALFWIVATASALIHASVIFRASHLQVWRGVIGVTPQTLSVNRDAGPNPNVGQIRPRRSQIWSMIVVTATGSGFLLCLVSAVAIKNLDPGWGGLLTAISPAWYVGLVLFLVAIFAGQRVGSVLAGLPVMVFQLALTGTPALVYDGPRYAWTVKQVGETSYILLHGFASPKINIYQAWPGIFSATAWLCRVSSFHDPFMVARWWPPVIDLVTLLLVYQLASRVLRDPRRAWLAAAVFVVGYTIGDADYFSPQSAAYFLAIAIFVVVFRHRDEKTEMSTSEWLLLLTMAIAEAVTHQLTPYMTTAALAVLVIFGRARTKWAPAVTLAPAVAWALAHYAYVSQNISFSALFNIFSNVTTPGASTNGPPPGTLANAFRISQGASALLIGLLAVAALLRYRTTLHVFLAACAASAGFLVFANSYGNEADFRVVLFALPWLAIMGCTIQPSSRVGSIFFWPVILLVLLPIYLVADMGLDFAYSVRTSDVAAVRYFESNAPEGSTLITIGEPFDDPVYITGRFNLVNEISYPNVLGFSKNSARNPATSYLQFMSRLEGTLSSIPDEVTGPNPEYFVLFTQQEAAYSAVYNYATLKQFQEFSNQFSKSPSWKVVIHTRTAELFQLRI